MSGFEPGEGWREVTGTSDMDKAVLVNYEDPKSRGWVREAPVPPLPTKPGIYVSLRPGWDQQAPLTLSIHGEWFQFGDPVDPYKVLVPWNGLVRLVPLAEVIRYFRKEAGPDAAPDDWRLRAARTIEAEWETE